MATPPRIALRGILLGALHGPKRKTPGYFSNQCPRTYAPKPAYAVRFWKERGLGPEPVPILDIIRRRAERYYRLPFETTGKDSLLDSGWRIIAIRSAGSAKDGNRQADAFLRRRSEPMLEWDIWATRE